MAQNNSDMVSSFGLRLPHVYQSVNYSVLNKVPSQAVRVLDIGCGGGDLGAALKARSDCTVLGVTFSEPEAELASKRLDAVEIADLNQIDPAFLGQHDCIVCCHVLEHLHDPQRLLRALANDCLAPNGTLIVALPNVLHWKQRLDFLLGRFRYTDGGVMDRTHFHFYDWTTAAELMTEAGLRTVERSADGYFPLSRLFGPLSRAVNQVAESEWPGLFGWQFVLCAKR